MTKNMRKRAIAGKTGSERRAAMEQTRRIAVRLVEKEGREVKAVGRLLGVHPNTVSRWLTAYREAGEKGLASTKATGRPPALSDAELALVRKVIVGSNPAQLNFGVLLWSLPIIKALVKKMFGKELATSTLSRYLGLLGLTPQRPIRRAFQRDDVEIKRWIVREFPRIARDVKRKQAVLLFLDETGVHENGPTGTTWAEEGVRPVVSVTGNRGRVNVISAVSPTGRLWFRCYKKNLNALTFQEFIRDLLVDIRGPIVLVMDSHPAHVAKATREYLESRSNRLQVEFLPAYAPELNPDEHVWGYLKGMFRRNPLQPGARIDDTVQAAMEAIKARPSLVRSMFGHDDLAYVKRNGVGP